MSRNDEFRYIVDFPRINRQIACYRPPTPRETNLLFVLAEAHGAEVPYNDLCSRLNKSQTSVQVSATKLREKLVEDWVVHSVSGVGLQLLYVPYPYRPPQIIKPDDPRIHYTVVNDDYREYRRRLPKRRPTAGVKLKTRVRLYD